MLGSVEVGANGENGVVLSYGYDPSGTIGVLKAMSLCYILLLLSSQLYGSHHIPCKAAF